MANKVDILIHPVRMKIIRTLMGNDENGLTPLEMAKKIKDVPQATLYRHIQVLAVAKVISVLKEKKVRSVTEKYYVLNLEEAGMKSDEWQAISVDDKLQYYTYYQLTLINQYEEYLRKLEKNDAATDGSTVSIIELHLDQQQLDSFQTELQELLVKYYKDSNDSKKQSEVKTTTVGLTIIPDA